jgi:hypothetical protein
MTYLMFQFTFMVLGALYATWRVVLAIFFDSALCCGSTG